MDDKLVMRVKESSYMAQLKNIGMTIIPGHYDEWQNYSFLVLAHSVTCLHSFFPGIYE